MEVDVEQYTPPFYVALVDAQLAMVRCGVEVEERDDQAAMAIFERRN